MAELFDSYASDFAQLAATISEKLDRDVQAQSGEAQKSTLRRVEMEIEEADEIIGQMELEVNSFPASLKAQYNVKLRGMRSELDKYKEQLRKSFQQARRGGGGGGIGGSQPFEDADDMETGRSSTDPQAQRQRLLQGTATLDDGSRRLENSHRLALETEDLGADILRDLRGQREQIENSRDTLRHADSNLDRSSRTINQMIRR
jgi:vesicle transport through interaction with t-SNAREs protein 1